MMQYIYYVWNLDFYNDNNVYNVENTIENTTYPAILPNPELRFERPPIQLSCRCIKVVTLVCVTFT